MNSIFIHNSRDDDNMAVQTALKSDDATRKLRNGPAIFKSLWLLCLSEVKKSIGIPLPIFLESSRNQLFFLAQFDNIQN